MKYYLIAFIIWNIAVYIVFGYDKWQAKREGQRVPEKVLMLMAFFFGAIGAWIGMQSFRHKTKHRLFTIGVPICIVLNLVAIYLIFDWNFVSWWLSK